MLSIMSRTPAKIPGLFSFSLEEHINLVNDK